MKSSSSSAKRGFTLLELIIVIAVLAILSVAVVLVINPAETLRRARDSQRFSDLSAIKSAIGLYASDVSTVILDGPAATTDCKDEANGEVFASVSSGTAITDTTFGTAGFEGDDGVAAGADQWNQPTAANLGKVDGNGWVPVKLTDISSGSPLSNFPVDPTNTVTVGAVVETDRLYLYACDQAGLTFELNGTLESTLYATTQDKDGLDGGDDTALYEAGTSLTIITSWE